MSTAGLLDRSELAVDVLPAARRLLGCTLESDTDDGTVAVRLVEVEAYRGADDPASHSYRGQHAAQRRDVRSGRAPLRLLRLRHALLRERVAA